jgi:secreted trypsin-like serine protease
LFASQISAVKLGSAGAPSSYIYGGTSAAAGQFKFLVGLYIDQSFLCGGFIIDKNHIGTAAHCIPAFNSNITVFLNDLDLASQPTTLQNAKVLKVHPQYAETTDALVYDVAILRMVTPLALGDTLVPIKLATSLPADGTTVYTAGYGETPANDSSAKLLYVDVPFVSYSKCNKDFWPNRLSEDQHICAGGEEGEGSCRGDSGGALFTTSNITHPTDAKVIGITSFGSKSCTALPGVYTDIPNFAGAWLEQQIVQSPFCRAYCRRDFRRCRGSRRACRIAKVRCVQSCATIL